MNFNGKKANFLGDSITEGVYTDIVERVHKRTDRIYCNVVGEILGLDTVRNYGISGTCICPDTVQLPELAFIKRYNEMDDDADLICVFGGTNDFGTDVKLGSPDDTSENTFFGALNILCDGLAKKYSGKTIVFMTPVYRVRGANNNGNTLQQYRDAIEKIAKDKFGFYVVDGMSLGLDGNTENLDMLLVDGLHPNPPAHITMGEKLAEQLSKI